MRLPLAALALAALAPGAAAQAIHGTVRDRATDHPIVAAAVTLLSERGQKVDDVLTDSTGGFRFEPDFAGNYRLKVEALGYREIVGGPVEVAVGELVEVALALDVSAVPLEPLTVTARSHPPSRYLENAGFYERRRQGIGTFLTREQIMKWQPEEFSDVMRHVPGISVQPTGLPGRTSWTMNGRAAGRCQPTLVLDGTPTVVGGPGGMRGRDVPIDITVRPEEIEGLELYKGSAGVPPEYNLNLGSCGLLLIWTRRR